MSDAHRLLDHPVIGQRYFFPRREAPPDPWTVDVDGATLAGFKAAPHGGPTLLHFHGNGEVVADWAPDFAPALVAQGLDVFLAEYRGYGGSSGAPMLSTMLDDALASCDATGVDPARMVVYGRSVGSLYALHVAANRPVAGLVLESGIADVLERLELRLDPSELDTTRAALVAAVQDRLDHRAKVRATRGPVLVLHAQADHLVPVSHGERLAEWAGERGELVRFEDGDHNSIHYYNGQEIIDRVVGLARRVAG